MSPTFLYQSLFFHNTTVHIGLLSASPLHETSLSYYNCSLYVAPSSPESLLLGGSELSEVSWGICTLTQFLPTAYSANFLVLFSS